MDDDYWWMDGVAMIFDRGQLETGKGRIMVPSAGPCRPMDESMGADEF